jgi:hypothetical protein
MLTIINFLILFFSFLILYQIFLAYFKEKVIEGMMDVVPTISPTFTPTAAPTNQMLPNLTINQVYRQYDKKIADNTFMLAQQNAGNIEYLKQRIDNVQGMYQQFQDLSGNVDTLQSQVNGLIQSQVDYANQITGGSAPEITGTIPEEEEETDVQDTTNLITE